MIKSLPKACSNCGSDKLDILLYKENKSGVQDGRLFSHDVSVEFVLGCEECSETLAIIPDYEMMRHINESFKSNSSQINEMSRRALEELHKKRN